MFNSKRLPADSFALLLISLLLPCAVVKAEAALELATPFTDNMILQRQQPLPVWGWAEPGSEVTVSFAGQTKTAKADASGKWMVKLDALEASAEERNFTVRASNDQAIELVGVLVGEVWFSSGQSNMVWIASKSTVSDLAKRIANAEEDIQIREINIETTSAIYPQDRAEVEAGGWKKSSEASGFSALSLAFAHSLYEELNVPIGILLSAHSNTRVEAFTQGKAILEHPDLHMDAKQIRDADVLSEQGKAAFEQYEKDILAWQDEAGEAAFALAKIPNRPNLPGIAGSWRGPSQFYNGKIHPVVPYAIRGTIWCQGTSNGGDGAVYADRMEALLNGYRDAWDMPGMPFIFTQMQSYGKVPNPDDLGFGEIRQSQHKFFIENRENVGMVVQFDVNAHSAGGIHYANKLHPGMRMARWALANTYDKDIPYTGPIAQGYKVEGDKAIVSFEKGSLFGGLMVGSKISEVDTRGKEKRDFEPARPIPDAELGGFRLCGADKKWHDAEAKIVGDTVVVTSSSVPKPIGVQYAYSAVPKNANLYNKAGLPATPFAQINNQFILISHAQREAELAQRYARYIDPNYPTLQVAEYYRDGVIIQRGKPIPVWGHANIGETVSITLGGVTKTTKPNKHQQWSVHFPALKASTKPITMTVKTTNGFSRTVKDILVGDVWYLTGAKALSSEWPYKARSKDAELPEPLPLVREFKRRTNNFKFATPRKDRFETGGGKYRSYWADADYSKEGQGVTTFAYHFAETLGRDGVPQGFMSMSAGLTGRQGVTYHATPLSWTSFHGVKDLKHPAFQARLNELFLSYPGTEIAKKATAQHLEEVRVFVQEITKLDQQGSDPSRFPMTSPKFPEPGKGSTIESDQIPTYAYNWNVAPHTPMAVAGVIWVPDQTGITPNPAEYAAELEAYAKSLPATYGMDKVPFYYAQPSAKLVPAITNPKLPDAKAVTFDQWPKSLEQLARQLAGQVQ
ncbi:MAG: sialate O-acetylesterase [Proteobacteria bacterium]|nr:sialate O-acetylesterase [Pseudomonadota bacterium]